LKVYVLEIVVMYDAHHGHTVEEYPIEVACTGRMINHAVAVCRQAHQGLIVRTRSPV
jgi:hypothetical protein